MKAINSKLLPEVPVVGLAAWSGTGKTSLLIGLVTLFRKHNLKTGVIKHAHHGFEIDHPGKDSYEIRKAGANSVLVGSEKRWALIVEQDEDKQFDFEEQLRLITRGGVDLIMVEGFKPESIPKIELYRPQLNKPLLFPDDDSIIAIATDNPGGLDTNLPILDLNNKEQIAEFIIDRFLSKHKINSQLADKI